MRNFSVLVISLALLSLGSPAAGQVAEITEPVWLARAPMGQLPERFSGAITLNVGLRCVVRSGALADCVPTNPTTPAAYLANATEAVREAQVAAEDAQGMPTEGRPIAVQIGFPMPIATEPPPGPVAPHILQNVVWLEQPDAQDFARLYPEQAQSENVSGRASLDCIVAGGRLICRITSEDPPGYGFGEATLRIAREFRVAPQTSDGDPTEGGHIRRTIRWVIS